MKREKILSHEFIEYIPDDLKDGTLYVSMAFATVVHKCCCGCGSEVVTPLSPTDWKLIFDGQSISLYPSIGNWNFACQSHYWIKNNRIRWASQWSQEEITAGRKNDLILKAKHFDTINNYNIRDINISAEKLEEGKRKKSFWQNLKKWFSWRRGSRH